MPPPDEKPAGPDSERELLKSIFFEASELPPQARAAYLARVCAGNDAMRREIDDLLGYVSDEGPGAAAMEEFPPGQVIGERFVLVRKVGEGGMGQVYEALDRDLSVDGKTQGGARVALKMIRPELSGKAGVESQFRRELMLSREVAHRNVCRMFDLGRHREGEGPWILFLSMEFLEGETLAERLRRGPLDRGMVYELAVQLFAGLEAVHAKGTVHRDLKPSNIHLVAEREAVPRLVVTDFGLARSLAPLGPTVTRMLAGTPGYTAPEQFESGECTVQADIYSLGVILYEMATGGRYDAVNARVILRQKAPEWAEVITRCLELDASKRPQQVADVRAGFQAPKRVRRAALARWVAGVAVAAALAGGAALWNREAPTSGSETPEVTRVTFDRGLADEPSVTADGKRMVYSSDKAAGGVSTIWVDELADGSSRMISKGDAHGTNPAISADGKWVVYRSERAGGGVYLVPAAGGEESLIAEDGRQPTFSPDGKRILYWTGQEGDSSMPSGKVWVFERETGKRTRYHEEFADARFPAWSPTGESILFRGSRGAGVRWNESADWYTTDGKRGAEATGAFAFLRKAGLTVHDARVFWAEDQILFSGRSGHSVNLWSLPVEGSKARIAGAVRALTTGTETESSPWLIGRGAVAYAHRRAFSHILRIPLKNGQPGQAEQTTLEEALDTRPSISDDGRRLLFTRWMGGVRTFLMLDVATGRQTPLLRDQPATPYLRPDGNEIAYSMPRGERNAVYVLAASGGEPKLLCDDCGEVAGWTGQGDRILFLTGTAGGVRGLSALDAATGARTELLPPMEGFSEASVSAQGVVAMAIRTGGTRSRIYVAKLGQEERVAVTDEAGWADKPRWAPDGKTLYFLSERDGFACVWRAAMGGDGRHPSRLEAVHHNHTRQHDLHHLSRPAQGLSVSANEVYLNVPNHTGSIWLMRMKEQRGVSFLSRLEGLLPNRGK